MVELRPYQREAVAASLSTLAEVRSALVVAATGTGKSLIGASIVAEVLGRTGKANARALWIAHRGELLDQAVATFRRIGLTASVEMGERKAAWFDDVTCASVQTIQGRRLESFNPQAFDVVVADECHHSVSASWRKVLAHFGSAKLIGLTATPDRFDKKGLGHVFDRVAYRYDLPTAIREGYLAPIVTKSVEVEGLDFSAIKKSQGDLAVDELDAIMQEESHLHAVARPTVELAGDRPTIVFAVTVEHAHALAGVLCRYAGEGAARAVHGGMDQEQRRRLLDGFARGEFRYLVNVAILTEGVDIPSVACVAIARPTMSRGLFCQMVGRATRLAPGKSTALVIDFVGNAGRHSLASVADILAGDRPDPVKRRAEEIAAKGGGGQLGMLGALDEAEREIAQEEADRIQRESERRRFQADVRYRVVDIPTDLDAHILGLPIIRRPDVRDLPSPDQLERLKSNGIDATGIDYGTATRICNALRARWKAGLCTLKQARQFAKRGLREDIPFEDARGVMDAIASNGWKVPADVDAKWKRGAA